MDENTDRNDLAEFMMKESGKEKMRAKLRDAVANQREASAGPYKAVVSLALDHSHEEIDEVLNKKRGRGRPSIAIQALRDTGLKGEVIAAIALQTLMNGATKVRKMQAVSERIGSNIEDEVRVRWFAKEVPALYRHLKAEEDRKGTVDYAHRRAVLFSAIPRLDVEETWKRWDLRTKANVGLWLVDLYVRLGVFEVYREGTKRHQSVGVRLTDEALREIATMTERMEQFARPEFRPMLIEPAPWTTPTDGGYRRLDVTMMKTRRRQDIERLALADMPAVYQSLNAVQRTPWRVNEDVLVVAEELRQNHTPIKGLPELREQTKPVRPDLPPPGSDLNDEEKDLLLAYKRDRRAWFDAEAKRSSRTTQAIQIMTIARDCAGEEAIYFPYQLDYRGRMYSVPQGLNPQGNDLSKGLLTFAEGKPLGVWGGYWLAVHGANTWGVDKGALSARVDWTLENSDRICACAEDPLGDMWWTEADGGNHPFQFLAFCFEWAGYIASGESEDYVSHLPVAVDGSCNGLQHFSAMLRDPVGARATNLTSDAEQQDIYQAVADRTNDLIRSKMTESATDRELGGAWVEFGVNRATVKRCVMTTPYGATPIGMRKMVLDDTVNADRTGFWRDRSDGWDAAGWLSDRIFEAIGETVAAAQSAMSFLRDMAKATNAAKQGIAWTTPAGLPVVQRLVNLNKLRVQTKLLGQVDLIYAQKTDKVDTRKQLTSVAPNFVHSLDAAHLMLTVCAMEEQHGRQSWAMVHDSYGTHAGAVAVLGEVLREQFVSIYETTDPLGDLRQGVTRQARPTEPLPEPPALGGFDLNEVLKAEFFFA